MEKKSITNTEIKNKPNSLPFCVYFEYSPIRRIPQNESLMKKKMFSELYIYLERYPRLSKVPKISRRVYTAGQTDHSFPTAGNVIKSNKTESILLKKKNYIDLIVNMKTENCKLINEWTLLFLSILHIYKHISVKSGLFKSPSVFQRHC